MSAATLLVELFTEELPPKALGRLGEAFAAGLEAGLAKRGFLSEGGARTGYATPRRLAVSITGVRAATEPRALEVKLLPVAAGLGPVRKPSPALQKKLAAAGLEGIDPARLKRRVDGKAETLFADTVSPSAPQRSSKRPRKSCRSRGKRAWTFSNTTTPRPISAPRWRSDRSTSRPAKNFR